jgi:hypothetical protein
MIIEKLASAVYNDVVAGLVGITSNPTISMDQLEDDIVDERLQVVKEYAFKGLIPINDLLLSINCIGVDCLSLDKCPCNVEENPSARPEQHFQIPQILMDPMLESVNYLGSTDKRDHYKIYTDPKAANRHKYKRRGCNDPYAYIDTTPNEDGMYDGWLFNAPFVKYISIMAIFKDPRDLKKFNCCDYENIDDNKSFVSNEVKKRLTEKKLRYYRQFYQEPTPNNQVPK